MSAIQTKPERAETALQLKILLLDVENSPIIGYAWDKWETDLIKIIHPRQIFSFAWKWLGSKTVDCLALPDFPGYKPQLSLRFTDPPPDNKALMKAMFKLISTADVVVGHKIKKFDMRRANTDMIKNGIMPHFSPRMVDTLEFARHKFDFESNKLDDLGQYLGVGRKVKHWGFELWERCMMGDPMAWALMKKYNKGDVDPLLEGVYLKMRPWMTNHPNACAPDKLSGCPHCRSTNLISKGNGISQWGIYRRFRCRDCGKPLKGQYLKNSSQWRYV